jgi:hypothetical protein
MTTKKKWAFRGVALLLALFLSELLLSLACLVSPRVNYFLSPPWNPPLISDDILGHRMSPYYPGNDAWGFRNQAVPEHCDILAVGDSMTYGYAATPAKSWPRQLEQLSGQSTYNCSCAGYGPCEYLVLLQKGLALKPKTVLLGLYVGNDILDAYHAVYVDNRFPQYRARNEAILQALAEAERVAALVDLEIQAGVRPASTVRVPDSLWPSLLQKSSLYALARAVRARAVGGEYRSIVREDEPAQDRFEVAALRPGRLSFDAEARVRTVFHNPEAHLLMVNLDDPRVREGLRITESLLAVMQARLQSQATRFVVLIIPSKGAVYRDIIETSRARMPAAFFRMLSYEERLSSVLEQFLKAQQIEFVNCLPALRTALGNGAKVYPESADSHPTSGGYRVIAETILPLLQARKS